MKEGGTQGNTHTHTHTHPTHTHTHTQTHTRTPTRGRGCLCSKQHSSPSLGWDVSRSVSHGSSVVLIRCVSLDMGMRRLQPARHTLPVKSRHAYTLLRVRISPSSIPVSSSLTLPLPQSLSLSLSLFFTHFLIPLHLSDE